MRAVDTNVLVRLITRDEAGQTGTAEAFVRPGAWVSILALAEAIWVLRAVYKRSAGELCDVIAMLLSNQYLTIEDPDVVAEALELYRARPALHFSDCLLVSLAKKAGHLPMGTFDRALGKVEGAQKL